MNLNQVTVPSLDVRKAVEFYQTLGLILIVDAIPDYARFVCPDGHSTFSIHQVTKISKTEGISIYFECDELDKKVDNLLDLGISFEEKPNDKPWLWREARLKDLDNNVIILFKAGENRINPPWKIKK